MLEWLTTCKTYLAEVCGSVQEWLSSIHITSVQKWLTTYGSFTTYISVPEWLKFLHSTNVPKWLATAHNLIYQRRLCIIPQR